MNTIQLSLRRVFAACALLVFSMIALHTGAQAQILVTRPLPPKYTVPLPIRVKPILDPAPGHSVSPQPPLPFWG